MLYLVDAVEGGDLLIHASKPALDFVPVTKQLYGIKWQRPSKMTLFAPDFQCYLESSACATVGCPYSTYPSNETNLS